MKKLTLIALSLCLVAGTTSLSLADEKGQKKERKEARRAETLKKYDKNGDGKLDESERAAIKEERKKNRKNKDSEPKKSDKD